ncbi:helix-turn-helix transcriptional regulator [Symbioplanes lichenis]|uniref:helix-turn-helix transcriptional regulator n=1 Tax=Symbioplanes lichenis TaxID=1629072 RepID=UPI00273976E6|nr:LuxR family transcriptional regulator [Actinoplanes lichenis]
MIAGRARELAGIDDALRHGGWILVHGPRGTGRSTVLAEAVRRSAAAGRTVLATRALPGDEALPGAGLQRLLMPLPALPPALARLMGATSAEPGPLDDAVRELADRLGAGWLWCVDDLDRLDTVSRAAVLGQRSVPVLASAVHPGEPVWHPVAPGSDWRPIALGPLGRRDAERLVAELRDHPGGRLVLAQSAGNPLALAELSRNLPPPGELPPTATELPVPPRLRRALAPTVGTLDPVRLRAAVLAAFATETPGRATARVLATLVRPEVWQGLAADGVLRPGPARRFTHPVVRAAVIDRAGLDLIRDARFQLAAALPRGAARAWHAARAGSALDDGLVAELRRAGDRLTRAGWLRTGAYALAAAAERSPDPDAAHRDRLHAAHNAHLAGEPAWAHALTAGPQAAVLAAGSPAVTRTGPIEAAELAPLMRALWLRGDGPSLTAVHDLLASGRSTAPLLTAWARTVSTTDPVASNPPTGGSLATSPGGSLAPSPGGSLAPSLGGSLAPDMRAMILGTMALSRHDTGLAEEHLRSAYTLAPPGGINRPLALGGLAWVAFDGGRYDEARTLSEQALTTDRTDTRAGALATLASVAVLRGDPDQEERLRAALGAVQPVHHAAHEMRLHRARGLAAWIAGEHDLAYHRLRRLYSPAGDPVHHRLSDLGLADLARVAVALNRGPAITPLVDAAAPRVHALRAARLTALWHRAVALLAEQNPAAEDHYRRALADPATARWPVERALAAMDYAAWLRRRHRPAESRPLLAEARDAFATAGLPAWRDRAAAELAAAAPPPRPGTAPGARLTPQQREVVALAAQGLTNPQIAARLGLSARTIGIHLSRAYPVLGVTRRSQLPGVVDDI